MWDLCGWRRFKGILGVGRDTGQGKAGTAVEEHAFARLSPGAGCYLLG